MANRLQQGGRVAARRIDTLAGRPAPVPDPDRLVHLQFRRFAGCPVCNLHLRSFVKAAPQLDGAGVRELVVFHSSAESLRVYEADLPFDVIPDPEKRLYREFGVEAHRRALTDPRAYGPILRAVGASLGEILSRRAPVPSLDPEGGRYGLPADFLIAPSGEILACKYGDFVYDQWSVEEVLALARARS